VLGGGVSGQTTQGLLDLMIWTGERLLAAELAPDGVVRRANAALLARVPGLVGQPVHAIVTPAHRAPLDAGLRGAAAGWSGLRIGLFPDADDLAAEHRVWLTGTPERILMVAELAEEEQPRVVDALLALDVELGRARGAGRSLHRAERERDDARRLLTGWRALSGPVLAAVAAGTIVEHALTALRAAVQADVLLVVHAHEGEVSGRILGASGIDAPAEARVPGPRSSAGRLAFGPLRTADDLLTIRLLSPHVAEAGARRLAIVPVPGAGSAALHAGWGRAALRGEDELALLEHAAAVMADEVAARAERNVTVPLAARRRAGA
jgi:hypothetical protein